jgi:hypothetical protein
VWREAGREGRDIPEFRCCCSTMAMHVAYAPGAAAESSACQVVAMPLSAHQASTRAWAMAILQHVNEVCVVQHGGSQVLPTYITLFWPAGDERELPVLRVGPSSPAAAPVSHPRASCSPTPGGGPLPDAQHIFPPPPAAGCAPAQTPLRCATCQRVCQHPVQLRQQPACCCWCTYAAPVVL